MPSFAMNCIGHQGQRSYTEYVFRIRHSSGCEWTVSRRYQELMEMHERLCAVFGDKDLPPFPPKATGGVVGVLFGQRPGTQPEVVKERERGFQRYFDGLCDRQDVVGTACFQAALAVVPPEPISHLRVQGWLPPVTSSHGLTALLDIRPEAAAADSCAVAEAYHVRALLVFREESAETEELCPVSDVRQPALGRATLARVEGLKPGAQVEFEVSAANAVGRSAPVAIRAMVPQASSEPPPAAAQASAASAQASAAAAEAPAAAEQASAAADPAPAAAAAAAAPAPAAAASAPTSPSLAPAADPQWLVEQELRIQQERQELERWWAERQREAERADAVREEEMAAFRAQREALGRQLSASSRCGSGSASPEAAASPLASPRSAEARAKKEAEELLSLEEDLKRREDALANREERVGRTESQLQQERQELTRAEGKLAVVQAHLLSLIDSQQRKGPAEEHRIDDGITPHHATGADAEEIDRSASIDGVWDADWVAPFKEKTPRPSAEEDSPRRTPGAAAAEGAASPSPQAAAAAAGS